MKRIYRCCCDWLLQTVILPNSPPWFTFLLMSSSWSFSQELHILWNLIFKFQNLIVRHVESCGTLLFLRTNGTSDKCCSAHIVSTSISLKCRSYGQTCKWRSNGWTCKSFPRIVSQHKYVLCSVHSNDGANYRWKIVSEDLIPLCNRALLRDLFRKKRYYVGKIPTWADPPPPPSMGTFSTKYRFFWRCPKTKKLK